MPTYTRDEVLTEINFFAAGMGVETLIDALQTERFGPVDGLGGLTCAQWSSMAIDAIQGARPEEVDALDAEDLARIKNQIDI